MAIGKKYTCFNCNTKFYDLNKAEPVCPKCGADQREVPTSSTQEAFVPRRRRKRSASPVAPSNALSKRGDDADGEEFDDELMDQSSGVFGDDDAFQSLEDPEQDSDDEDDFN